MTHADLHVNTDDLPVEIRIDGDYFVHVDDLVIAWIGTTVEKQWCVFEEAIGQLYSQCEQTDGLFEEIISRIHSHIPKCGRTVQ